MSANSILRAALSVLAKIEPEDMRGGDPVDMTIEVRRLAREAMARSDQVTEEDDAEKFWRALQEISLVADKALER